MGFTHRGRQLEYIDDYREEVPVTSEEEGDDLDVQKGRLSEKMVMEMNFGGG